MRRGWVLVWVMLVLLPIAGYADDSVVDRGREAYALSRELMSPYCPGRTLADCPSPNAAALREEIRDQLAAGATIDEVRGDLERRFGDQVRAVPRGPLVWGIPILVLLAGAIALAVALRRLSRPQGGQAEAISPELEREIERELRERGL
jgi:cytochrome c-type biogenesis protein CcmH